MPHEPFSDDEKLEADLLAEDFTGSPVNYGSTAAAIAALEKRIAHLYERQIRLLALPPKPARPEAAYDAALTRLENAIAQTETDLANYRQQQDSRN